MSETSLPSEKRDSDLESIPMVELRDESGNLVGLGVDSSKFLPRTFRTPFSHEEGPQLAILPHADEMIATRDELTPLTGPGL